MMIPQETTEKKISSSKTPLYHRTGTGEKQFKAHDYIPPERIKRGFKVAPPKECVKKNNWFRSG